MDGVVPWPRAPGLPAGRVHTQPHLPTAALAALQRAESTDRDQRVRHVYIRRLRM